MPSYICQNVVDSFLYLLKFCGFLLISVKILWIPSCICQNAVDAFLYLLKPDNKKSTLLFCLANLEFSGINIYGTEKFLERTYKKTPSVTFNIYFHTYPHAFRNNRGILGITTKLSHCLQLRHTRCACNNEIKGKVSQNTTSLLVLMKRHVSAYSVAIITFAKFEETKYYLCVTDVEISSSGL